MILWGDFAAWLGLVPKQNSSGGKQALGHTSKMGQRDIRRLLIIGAMSVIRWFSRNAPEADTWLECLLRRKPLQRAAIALANKRPDPCGRRIHAVRRADQI